METDTLLRFSTATGQPVAALVRSGCDFMLAHAELFPGLRTRPAERPKRVEKMVRSNIYLTEIEWKALCAIALVSGKSIGLLVRTACDFMIAEPVRFPELHSLVSHRSARVAAHAAKSVSKAATL
jgi:hypothetical protein